MCCLLSLPLHLHAVIPKSEVIYEESPFLTRLRAFACTPWTCLLEASGRGCCASGEPALIWSCEIAPWAQAASWPAILLDSRGRQKWFPWMPLCHTLVLDATGIWDSLEQVLNLEHPSESPGGLLQPDCPTHWIWYRRYGLGQDCIPSKVLGTLSWLV